MKRIQEGVKVKLMIGGGIIAIIAVILFGVFMQYRQKVYMQNTNPELARAMEYEEVKEGDEEVEGTDYVQFDAFFLRDINQDGYAESIRGTCKPIGQDDTLYMELNVQTAGYLKNAKIDINGENFYLQTSLPKDNELKDNYIGNNIKTIEFNDIANGTQKMLTGLVRSGDYGVTSSKAEAIGNNINNYSKVNSVTLTGTYVGEDETEIAINKTVEFNIDWYGETKAGIYSTFQNKDITNAIDEEKRELSLDFTVYTQETDKELIISKNHVEGEIPELNGYKPLRVEYTGSNGAFKYDTQTRIFTIDRNAQTNAEGNITTSIARSNSYGIKVVYPIEAYQELGQESVQIRVPVRTYYEGYNNPNEGFTNPYKSNTATATIIATYDKPAGTLSKFDVTVGKYVYNPTPRYIVSKEKPLNIYNGIGEKTEDTYTVQWKAYVGTDDISSGIVMQETREGEAQVTDNFIKTDSSKESTDGIVTNMGIYFTGADGILGEDGWIKVYDAETDELIHEFTADEWNKYSSNNPYRYEVPVKHIRVETSNVIEGEKSLYVYNVKEIDDDKLTEKYTEDEFDQLQYIESTLVGYRGEKYINQDMHQAHYEAPISVANISIINNTISTQTTEENALIKITTETNASYNEVNWQNGTFLVKLPAEIIDVQLNEVKSTSSLVKIESYELIENEEGTFIKIVTKNDTPTTYSIQIDADLTADPRNPTATRNIELYATNENGKNYYYSAKDKYDANNNSNTEEQVNYRTTSISMVAPNSLITAQTASNFDENGSEIISPEIADLKPIYAVVDQEQKEQTATIGVQIRNNYGDTISEISILGKIPFEGNTYVISGKDLGSTFTTKMTNEGIEIPEELKQYVTVYYSENSNPTKDLNEQSNGWKTANQVTNWDNVKTYLIDLGDFVMQSGDEYVFNYTVKIPNGLEFNKVAFSHHGVYFSLDTDQGKYKTETEPNRLGLRIAEKYDLELTKYQTERDIVIPGATYRVTDVETGESKTGITNAEGKITIGNLYAEKEYEMQELKSPDDYELNENVIRFIGHVDENGVLTIEKKQGTTKGDMTVTKEEGENYKAQVAVEDEVKARLRIIKKDALTGNEIPGVKFEIGEPYSGPKSVVTAPTNNESKTITTDKNGETIVTGLTVGKGYYLKEIKAEGYYVDVELNFVILNNDGKYEFELYNDSNVTNQEITEENGIPTINLTIENEKIPTYDLQIVKIKKTTESTLSEDEKIANVEADLTSPEVEYLEGAKFRLYKGTELIGEYTTDAQGRITIPNLYQYEGYEYLDEMYNQIYTLKEVKAPSGYAKVQDITFRAENQDGKIVLKEIDEKGEEKESERYSVEGNTVQLVVEDSPTFKLIKKDGETKETLAGVKFAIYNVENGQEPARNSKGEIIGTKETINGVEYYTVTTNSKGEITEDLPQGLYKAVEVEADDKYDILGNAYYFGIDESKELEKELIPVNGTSITGISNEYINSVTSTSDGGYVVGGQFDSGNITVGEYTLNLYSYSSYNENSDVFVIKYDSQGNIIWIKQIGSLRSDYDISVIETKDKGILVKYLSESYDVIINDETVYSIRNEGINIYLIKFNMNGEMEWITRTTPSIEDFNISAVTEDIEGNIILGGSYFGKENITIGEYTLKNQGEEDSFVIKYASNGEIELVDTIGGSSNDYINSIEGTSDGGYIVGGTFSSDSIEVGGDTLINQGGTDGFIIKYTENNAVEWVTNVGKIGDDEITIAASTIDGGYIVGGNFSSDSIEIGEYTLINKGGTDSFIIKYNDNNKVEWVTSVGGADDDNITTIETTSDKGYLVGGYSQSDIQVGDYSLKGAYLLKYNINGAVEYGKSITGIDNEDIWSVVEISNGEYIIGGNFNKYFISKPGETQIGDFTLAYKGYRDGFIIQYLENTIAGTNASFADSFGGSSSDEITSVTTSSDGGYVVGGDFVSANITVGDYTFTNNGNSQSDSYIIKYNANNYIEWVDSFGGNKDDKITSVSSTSDGGYIVGGYFSSDSIQVGNYTLTRTVNGQSDNYIIKYNKNGEVEWADSFGGSKIDEITSVSSTSDGGYIVGGYFTSDNIKIGNYTLTNNGGYDGFIIKYSNSGEVEWARSVGGTSSDYINSVATTSDGEYIIGGYFNSAEIQAGDYTLTRNGGYDGMIIKYNKNGEVKWADLFGGSSGDEITSLSSTSDGGYIVGGYFTSDNIKIGNYTLTNNGGRDSFIIKYSANNEIEWSKSFGGSKDDEITSVVGTQDENYIVGGYFSSDNLTVGDYTLTNNGGAYNSFILKYNTNNEIEWADSYGDSNSATINTIVATNNDGIIIGGYFYGDSVKIGDYILENQGNITPDGYLSDGFIAKIYPDTNIPEVQEFTVENNRKEYSITTDVKEINGVRGGSISGEDENPYETVKYGDSSTKEIVMTPEDGYEIIGITINGKEYPFKANENGTYIMSAFTNVTENKHIEVTYALTSNKFTISKIDSKTKEPLSGVKFRIENIDEETTNAIEIATNSEGKAITQLEYGRYQITEVETADGYKLLDNPIIIDFTRDGNNIVENNNDVNITVNEAGELEIENKETAKVIVHHYLKDKDGTYTKTKVAEDEVIEQTDKEEYTTRPKLDLEKYELEKDENGTYVIPENSKGKYIAEETIEVKYYYVSKEIPLTVHYYIEGTEDSVPLANGGVAEDETYIGEEGEQYATNSINASELSERYELVEVPQNATGTYEYNEVVVTYYYRLKQSRLLIEKVGDSGEKIPGVTLKIVNKETLREWTFETDENGIIDITLDNGQYEITEITAPEEYKLLKNPISVDVEINKENQITIENEKYKKFDFNINKVDSATGKKISGIKFKLTYTTQYGEQKTEEYVTDENGLAKIPSLYEGIQYQLQEIETIPGYSLDDQIYEFNVEYNNGEYILNTQNPDLKNIQISGNQINVDIENEPTFKLIKEGTKGERVAGAKFTITDEEGNTVVDGNNNFVGEVEEINGEDLRVVTTDVDGKIVENLLPGRYVVTEVQAPDGYEMPENEEDRSQLVEIKGGEVTVSKDKELSVEEMYDELSNVLASDVFQVVSATSYNNGMILYGGLLDDLVIPKEYTTSGEEIKLEKGGELGSSLTLYINIEGKIEKINYIKSDSNSFAYTTIGAENRNNETMAVGIYINSIKIPADKTESGEEIILTYSGTTDGIPGGIYLISYNANNKVKFVKDITYMGDLVDSITSPTDHRMYAINDTYVLEAYSLSDTFTVPAEETVANKEIRINLTDTNNPIMLVLNNEGKVINAKEEKEETSLEDNIDEILGSTSTSTGTIVSGASLNTVTIPAEETVNGEDIILEKDKNSMAIGVMAKYNEAGKIEWVNKISNGYNVYIYEVSDGYISIGMYVNELTIAKEDTANGQEITLTGSEQQLMLIKNNNLGQVVWAMNMDMEDLQKFDGLPQITETQDGFVISDYYNNGNSIFYKETNQNTIPIAPVEITITNKTLESLNVPVSKVWDDDSDKAGNRPESVIFKLTGSDGSVYTKELTVPGTEGSTTTQDSDNPNKWNDIFENLPRFDQNGNRITYTLTEEEKTEGDLKYYDIVVDSENNIITNTSKYGKVTVHYYIQNPDGTLTTNRVPDTNGTEIQDIIIEGKEGDEYSTEPVENVSDKYALVEEKLPANAEGTLEKYNEEKPQEVIYYYRLKPAKVIINYLEKDSDSNDNNNQVLSEPEEINGYVDDKYNTDTNHKKQTIVKDGKTYTLVENSKNTEGTMTVEDINVTYYYLQNTKATVRYVERNPETHEIIKDLEEPYTEEGLVGDEFVTNEKAFTGYRLVEAPKDKTIKMTKEEQTLIYYYEPIMTGLVENHIDDITGKVLYTKTHNVQVGQNYNIPSKEFAGYDLVETKLPNNSTGIMGEELVTVNYYYIKKAVLEVNYIDKATGKPLAEQIVDETKREGDSYTTVEKTFEGYELIEEPENATGTMEVEVDADGNIVNNRTVVTYYYGKPAEVEEHHIDILTKEELEEPTIHKGYVGEEYNIPSKEFLSYVVAVDDGQGNNILPENAEGKYTEEKQVVTYYYYQPAKVIVHYVDKTTGKEIQETNEETGKLQSSQVVIEGTKDLDYITTAKEFSYYTLVQRPEQEEGTMKVEITKDENGKDIVNNTIDVYYYYEPKAFNIGVDKTISKITVNGEEQNISNNKLTRVEIYRKNVNDTKVEIEYTIKVTNNGEVDGKAIIRENIPDGMSVADNDGTWDEKDGYLEKVITDIKAGETKEYKITLAWDGGDKNLGEKNNKVEITQTDNIPGFKDNNDQDNSSEARVLINVSTGSIPWPLVIGLLALVGLEGVTLSYARILTNKQKKNRK